jgi:integrase
MAERYTARNTARGDRRPTWLEDILRFAVPEWLSRDLSNITKADVADRHDEIATARGTVAAARFVMSLRTVFRYAEEMDLYTGRNVAKTVKIRDSQPRQRTLSADEKARIIEALESGLLYPWVHDYFKLLILTGARRGNVASMKWADVDLDRGLWSIPADDFKTGQTTTVVLTTEAVTILKSRANGSPYVFPSRSKAGHLADPWKYWRQVTTLARVEGLTIHDLRRSFGSELINKGIPLPIVAAAMGHRNVGTTARHYSVVTTDSVRDALER